MSTNKIHQFKEKNKLFSFEYSTKYILIVYSSIMITFLKSIWDVEAFYDQNSFPKTPLWNFLYIIPGFAFSRTLYIVVEKFSSSYIASNLAGKSKLKETHEVHVNRVVKLLYSMIFYALSTMCNYHLIRKYQSDHMLKFFGGQLNLEPFLTNWPKLVATPVLNFFVFSIGHHVERIVEHVTHSQKYQSYWTMLLHHVLTVSLMVNCFFHRQFEFGIPVLFLHDIADIAVNLCKFCREFKPLKFLVMPSYFLMLSVWIVTRNYIFSFEIVSPMILYTTIPGVRRGFYSHVFASFGVCILMVLNIYWALTISYSGYAKIMKGIDQDYNLAEKDKKS